MTTNHARTALAPCSQCGSSEKNSRGECIPCARLSRARYRAANKEKLRAKLALYRTANAEKLRAGWSRYYIENAETRRAYAARYSAANPDGRRRRQLAYRARKAAVGGNLSPGLSERLLTLQRGKCACCGKHLGKDYHLDHIMPLALGGSNTDDNIQLLRARCNLQKHAKHPVEFMRLRGLLL